MNILVETTSSAKTASKFGGMSHEWLKAAKRVGTMERSCPIPHWGYGWRGNFWNFYFKMVHFDANSNWVFQILFL